MELRAELKRLTDVGRARRMARAMCARERAPRERLDGHARAAVDAMVRHAAARSPLYRERFAGLVGAGPVDLAALPVLDKATLMDRFDDLVCDRRLRRDALLEHLDGLDRDALYLGEHRVMTTSGSSGRKALFVYDRAAWVGIVAQFFRYTDWAGVRPRIPRLRIAAIGGGSPTHMSRRAAATIDVGLHRVLPLAVTMPLERIVAALNDFQPQFLNAYPSIAALLAEEQRQGRLSLALEGMSTSSEMRPPELTERLTEAFGVRPVDLFGSTEGLWGCTCAHGAMHLFEDMTVVENVDADGRPVPDGERGSRLLVTSLFNRVQPLIRLELSDVMALDRAPCPCGRTLVRATTIEGRADDVIHLAGAGGRPVAVHPLQFAVVTADRDVRAFQIVQEGERVRVRVVLADGADAAGSAARLHDRVAGRLAAAGVARPDVEVQPCPTLERSAGGKLQMVVADRRAVTSARAGAL